MTRNLKDPVRQTVHFTRTATKDLVTGKVTYGAWSPDKGKWDAFQAPAIDGYQANPTNIGEEEVTADTKNKDVNIMYTAIGVAITINFVDTQNNNSVVKSQAFNGLVGQKPNIDLTALEQELTNKGYTIGDNNIPKDVAFTDKAQTYSVNLSHQIASDISESNPQGVADLGRDVTRTINIITNN